jgi:RNA polymerase sigma-70 factor (ECF subfamily)
MAGEESDEVLMTRIQGGDEKAFRTLIERHQDRVYGTVARMMGGAGPEAEEAAQDIFLRVWRSAGTYRAEGKFTTWLMTVVRNQVFTRAGQKNRRKNIDGEDPVDEETGESWMEKQADAAVQSPAEALSFRDLEKAVEEACRELPENQRLVVHLRQYEGMEFEEIGKITGMSLTAVKALMFRARENLKKKLSGYLTASN